MVKMVKISKRKGEWRSSPSHHFVTLLSLSLGNIVLHSKKGIRSYVTVGKECAPKGERKVPKACIIVLLFNLDNYKSCWRYGTILTQCNQ